MFSTNPKINFCFLVTYNFLSANTLDLDQSKKLLFGRGLNFLVCKKKKNAKLDAIFLCLKNPNNYACNKYKCPEPCSKSEWMSLEQANAYSLLMVSRYSLLISFKLNPKKESLHLTFSIALLLNLHRRYTFDNRLWAEHNFLTFAIMI